MAQTGRAGDILFSGVYLKSRKFSLFLQTQLDFALNSLEIHKGFLRLFALNPACACEIFVIFFVFRYTLKGRLKKKRRRLDGKSKRLRRISAHTGQQQLAVCPADGIPGLCRPCSDGTARKVPCVDGRSSFFQIAAFLLREGGGVSPSTLECRPIYSTQPLALRRGVLLFVRV